MEANAQQKSRKKLIFFHCMLVKVKLSHCHIGISYFRKMIHRYTSSFFNKYNSQLITFHNNSRENITFNRAIHILNTVWVKCTSNMV